MTIVKLSKLQTKLIMIGSMEKNIMFIKSQLVNALIDLDSAKSDIVPSLNVTSNLNCLEKKVHFISEYLEKHLSSSLYDSYKNFSENFLMDF